MTIDQIEENVKKLFQNKLSEETFVFDFLLAYGQPKTTVSRLKKGDYNLSKIPGEYFLKKKFFFKIEKDKDIHKLIDDMNNDDKVMKNDPHFIIITDFKIFLCLDRKSKKNLISQDQSISFDTLDINIKELPRYFDFFLPLAGMEKSQVERENLADRRAAEKLGKLYDLILQDNLFEDPESIHSLNVFLSRLLFCFFAEDTGIFSENKFTNSIKSLS